MKFQLCSLLGSPRFLVTVSYQPLSLPLSLYLWLKQRKYFRKMCRLYIRFYYQGCDDNFLISNKMMVS